MAGTKRDKGNNRWRLEYMYEGERYSKNISATSPTEANRQLALFVAAVEKGQFSRQDSITFTEFAQLFLDKYAKPNLSETTVKDYIHRLNKHILNDFGRMKLSSIKRLHIQEFANKLVEEYNLSSKTVKNYINVISAILNKAIEWDYLQNNVADKVSIPKNINKSKKKVVLYSYEEIETFLDKLEQLEDEELKMAIYTSFYTGARRAEVLALTFNDINIANRTIDFNKSKIAINGGTKIKDTKTGKPRIFYIPQSYTNKIEEYYIYKGCPKKSTALFNMHPDTFSNKFREFLINNNLREINLKDLRALNESLLVNKGIDIVLASKRLGHLPTTATNYYLDQIPEEDKKASQVLEDLFPISSKKTGVI